MKRNRLRIPAVTAALLCVVLPATSCATHFSPAVIRDEIYRQNGRDPLSTFELNLGRFTTLLLKSALTTEDGETPFAGLSQLQLAVYEAPSDAGPALDVTLIPVQGWEPVVRLHDESRSGLVLVKGGRSLRSMMPGADDDPEVARTIGDLVFVGAGSRNVVYARLRGRLRADLPSTLGDVFRDGGPERVREILSSLADSEP